MSNASSSLCINLLIIIIYVGPLFRILGCKNKNKNKNNNNNNNNNNNKQIFFCKCISLEVDAKLQSKICTIQLDNQSSIQNWLYLC